jgi:glycosyltransferase 2 family protein
LCSTFLAVLNVWVSALAFSSDVDFLTILIAVPAIMLIMNLPISIGGLGLMEAAYTIIFTAFGYSSALALSTALLIRLKTLVDGVIGGIFYLLGSERGTAVTKTNR